MISIEQTGKRETLKVPPGATSASQIVTARQCIRKWAFKSIGGLHKPQGKAAAFGSELHDIAEKWLTLGIPPPMSKAGRLFLDGIPYLPAPGMALAELGFVASLDGAPLVGFIDCLWPGNVLDHKTTSKPEKALTAEGLHQDPQGVLYSIVGCKIFGSSCADLTWLYYPTIANRAVFPVRTGLPLDEAEAYAHAHFVPVAKLLTKLRAERRPDRGTDWINRFVPCNPTSCDFVGWFCDFADECTLHGEIEDMASTPEERLAELQAKIAAQQGQQPQPQPQPQHQPQFQAPQQPQFVQPQPQPQFVQPQPQFVQPQQQLQFAQPQQQAVAVNQGPAQSAPAQAPQQFQAPTAPAASTLESAIAELRAVASKSGFKVEVKIS